MASCTSGPQVFGRLKLGRVRRQEHQVNALRHDEVLRCVPAGAVQDEHDALPRPGADRLGEVLQGQREDLRVHLGQDEPLHLAAAGADEAVEVEPLVPALPQGQRSLAAARPHAAHDGDQPQARFVLRPELDSRAGTLSMNTA